MKSPAEPPVSLPAPHMARRPPRRNPSDSSAPDSSAPPATTAAASDDQGFDWTMFILGTAAAAAISGIVTYLITRGMDAALSRRKENPQDHFQVQIDKLREEFLSVVKAGSDE